MAIQLSPDQPDVFFHRAALLRERNPLWAIEDYSISILLDDSPRNIEAFYQRGMLIGAVRKPLLRTWDCRVIEDNGTAMLYYKAGQYDLSIADYLTGRYVPSWI